MTYLLRYTPQAVQDMNSVWDGVYEASKSHDIAYKYIKEFSDTIADKKQFPSSGSPLIYKGLFTGLYYVSYKRYKAFYRIKDKYIEVIRISMSKRDYMSILFEEDKDEE